MKTKANQELKKLMKDNCISQHDLSKELGISDTTLWRRLRDELEEDQKEFYINTIHKIIETN